MKECTKCKKVKPLDGFHKSKPTEDGLQPICKECRKVYFANPLGMALVVYLKRTKTLERSMDQFNAIRSGVVLGGQNYYKCSTCNNWKSRRKMTTWRKTYCKQCASNKVAEYRSRNGSGNLDIQIKAHGFLNYAAKTGKIKRPCICASCNQPSDIIHGHHKDYQKPLDVVWLCPPCHGDIHKKVLATA